MFGITKSKTTDYQSPFSTVGAIFIGISVPLVASSPTVMAISALLGFIFIFLSPGRKDLLRLMLSKALKPLALVIICLFLAWLPAVFDSIDIEKSLSVWARMLAFLIIASTFYSFLLGSYLRRKSALCGLITASTISSLVGLIAIYFYSPILSLYRLENLEVINAAQTLKYYGSAEGCLSIVILWAGFKLGGIWKPVALLKALFGIILIVSVDSDSGLLAFIIGMACSIFVMLESKIISKRITGVSVLLFSILSLIALSIILAYLPSTPDLSNHKSTIFDGLLSPNISTDILDVHRQHIWAFSLNEALKSPIIGYGIDISNYLPGAQVVATQFNQAFIPGHPHSWFLEVFLETGAIGLFFLIFSLLVLLWCWHKIGIKDPLLASVGISLFGAFWVSSMINFSIWSSWWQGVFLILTAILLAFSSTEIQNQQKMPLRK